MRPRARSHQLVIQELPTETLVFDQRTSKAHCLNETTALVWRHCDGRNDLAGLARLVERELGITGSAVVVQLALEQLATRHLLETPIDRGSSAQRRSRREVLKQLAAAITLPGILTVAAPRANAAASHCPSGQVMCNGTCVTPAAGLAACTANCQCAGGKCIGGSCCIPNGSTCSQLVNCNLCCANSVTSCNMGQCICGPGLP